MHRIAFVGVLMSDSLADLTTRLGQTGQQIMKETDPAKYDGLGAEIWRVLSERERLVGQSSFLGNPGPRDLCLGE